ncbi:MAG: 6-phosphogluconolactonase [Chromatiales bacterium]|nr:6-phosphogluconolactonase [Chromatiales bacterium]
MRVEVLATPELAAQRAAQHLADALRAAIRERGRACLALSGGSSPVPMFRALARQAIDWSAVHVFQVDERVVRRGDASRNLTTIEAEMVHAGPLPAGHLHAMPVEAADLAAAAGAYGSLLADLAGTPVTLDAVHLGLGSDGHTASLFPGDPALAVTDRTVAVTGLHAGFRRLTLTYPALDAARLVVWFAVGAGKQGVVKRLAVRDPGIPAGRVAGARAFLVVDDAAGCNLGSG